MAAVTIPFYLVKKSLSLLASGKREKLIEACLDPASVQKELKERIIRNSRLPFPDRPTDYTYYQDKNNLTLEPVKFFETTSGSTGSKKEIPYTKSLLKSYQNMFLLWAHDLIFHSGIDFQSGKFFMSISPRIGEINSDDRKYLSSGMNLLLNPFLASDPNNHHSGSSEEFFFKVSRDLLKNRDLEIFSIWSPTYLLSLLEFMENHQRELELESTVWEEVWPNLKLISCWTNAQAKKPAALLKNLFPNTTIQSKGLLLTEAPVTIPWFEAGGHIPLLTETYLEFLKGDSILSLDQLKEGEKYVVLTSQFNGYLRYNTQDEILITGFYKKVPVIEFLGRTGNYSDLAGEKLSEPLLIELFSDVKNDFLLVPDQTAALPSYKLFTDNQDVNWEERLRAIYHYDLARKLNQLKHLQVVQVNDIGRLYREFCQRQGMNLGDIKEKFLLSNPQQAKGFLEWIDKEHQSFL